MIYWPGKGADEVLDYSFVFTLDAGETITSKVVTGTGVTVDGSDIVNNSVRVWLSGGADSSLASVKAVITTSAGRTFDAAARLAIGVSEPVSLDEMRLHLRVDDDDDSEDSLITALISAARRACENTINRSVIGTTRTARFSAFPRYPNAITGVVPARGQLALYLEGGPVASVQSVTYYDASGVSQTFGGSAYVLDGSIEPALLTPLTTWPLAFDRPDAVAVTYTIAPLNSDDMAVVVQAIKLLVGQWFRDREANARDFRGTTTEMPLSVTWLLNPLRIIPFR